MKITEKKLRDAKTFASIPVGTDFHDVHGNKFRKINGSRAVRKRSDMVSNPKFKQFAASDKVLPVAQSEATAHLNNVSFKKKPVGPWVIVAVDLASGRLVAHQKSSPNWGVRPVRNC